MIIDTEKLREAVERKEEEWMTVRNIQANNMIYNWETRLISEKRVLDRKRIIDEIENLQKILESYIR